MVLLLLLVKEQKMRNTFHVRIFFNKGKNKKKYNLFFLNIYFSIEIVQKY